MKTYATAKIAGARVTAAELEYEGSISIGRDILAAAGIDELEQVHINSLESGQHWRTYVIAHDEDGTIQLNGPPANLFDVGDRVVIVRYELLERRPTVCRIVKIGPANDIVRAVLFPAQETSS